MSWPHCWKRRHKEYIESVGGATPWKIAIWRLKKEMGIEIWLYVKMEMCPVVGVVACVLAVFGLQLLLSQSWLI
jgi:hypothetical protein